MELEFKLEFEFDLVYMKFVYIFKIDNNINKFNCTKKN